MIAKYTTFIFVTENDTKQVLNLASTVTVQYFFTYPTFVFNVFSSIVKKQFHSDTIAFFGCNVQGSLLMERKEKNDKMMLIVLQDFIFV